MRIVAITLLGTMLAFPGARRGYSQIVVRPALVDSTKLQLAHSFLVLTGMGQAGSSAMIAASSQQRQALSQVPGGLWDSLQAGMRRLLPSMVDSLAPEYAARFTTEELREIIRFYDSPVGRHLISQQPELVRAGIQLGQRWAARLVEQFTKDFKERAEPSWK